MSPILTGVIASGISGNLTPPWSPEGAYDSLATISLSTATSTITFSSIPTGYKHLQIRYSTLASAFVNDILLRFNNDSGSNYSGHYLYGSGSSAVAGGSGGQSSIYAGYTGNTTSPSGTVLDILDYANVNKNKTTRALSGADNNGSGFIQLVSGAWFNTSAVTSITLTTGTTWQANSSFALYGVK